jgi:ribonuclease HII
MTLDWKKFEKEAKALGFQHIAGIDEAGRGPLAGPVVAAACIIKDSLDIPLINDSKKMSEKLRDQIFDEFIHHPDISYGIGIVDHLEIDQLNILQATFLAMKRAVEKLSITPDLLLVDGNQSPKIPIKTWTIVKGDALSQSIAMASILAKVTRDRLMLQLDSLYPKYGFAQHKGYPTAHHKLMIQEFGLSPVHRKTFKSTF